MKMDFLGEEVPRHGHKNRKMVFEEAAYLGPDFTWGKHQTWTKKKHTKMVLVEAESPES
jgi:hypothetical protein